MNQSSNKRILIGSDNKDMKVRLKEWIENNNYKSNEMDIYFVKGELYKNSRDFYDLLILDESPNINVLEFFPEIRLNNPEMPIIFISNDRSIGLKAIEEGGYTYFLDSFKKKDLIDTINDLLHQDKSLQLVTSNVCELLKVPLCLIWTLDSQKGLFKIKAWNGKIDSTFRKNATLDYYSRASWDFFKQATPLSISDVTNKNFSPNYKHHKEAMASGLTSLLTSPMIFQGKVYGIIDAYSIGGKIEYTKHHKRFLHSFASQAAMILNKQEMLYSSQTLREINYLLSDAQKLDSKLSNKILSKTLTICGADSGCIYELDRQNSVLKLLCAVGFDNFKIHEHIELEQILSWKELMRESIIIEQSLNGKKYCVDSPNIKCEKIHVIQRRYVSLGVIVVNKKIDKTFFDDEQKMLSKFSDYMADYFDRNKSEIHIGELRKLSFKEEFDKVFEYAVKAVHDLTGLVTVLWMVNDKRDRCLIKASYGLSDDYKAKNPYTPLKKSITGKALQDKKLIWRKDIQKDNSPPQFYNKKAAKEYGWHFFICVPLLGVGGYPLGTLSLYGPKAQICSIEQQNCLLNFSNYISMAIEYNQRRDQLTRINEIGILIADNMRELQLKSVLTKIAKVISNLFHANIVAIYPYESYRELFFDRENVVTHGVDHERLPHEKPRNQGLASIIRKQEILIVPDVECKNINNNILLDSEKKDLATIIKEEKFIQELAIKSFVGLSIKTSAEKNVGVMYIDFNTTRKFSNEELALMQLFSQQVGRAIQYSRRIILEDGLNSLEEINEAVISKPFDTVLRLIVEKAAKTLPGEHADLWLASPGNDGLFLEKIYGPAADKAQKIIKADEGSVNLDVFNTQKPFYSNNINELNNFLRIYSEASSCVTVPLIYRNETIGTINVETSKENAYSEEHMNWLLKFANRASIAIELKRQKNIQIQALNEISESIQDPRNLQRVLVGILKWTRSLLKQATMAEIRDYLPQSQELLKNLHDGVEVNKEVQRLPINKGITGRAARLKETQMVNDTKKDDDFIAHLHADTNSEIAAPMVRRNGTLIGVLNIEHSEKNAYTEEDKNMATALANLASVAIENSLLYIQLENQSKKLKKQRENRIQAIENIANSIIIENDQEKIYMEILKACNELLNHPDACDFFIMNNEDKILEARHFYGQKAGQVLKMEIGEGITGFVAETKELLYVPDVTKDERYKPILDDIRSELAIPMLYRDKQLIGVLNIEHHQKNAFSKYDIKVAEAIARLAVIAVENMRIKKELDIMHDISTKIINAIRSGSN